MACPSIISKSGECYFYVLSFLLFAYSQNYRGIALSSLFSKFFDHCIISCEEAAQKSDDLQFGYKSGMPTIQCASVVTETINYYLHNKRDIYIYICV